MTFFHDLLLPVSGVVDVDGINPDVRVDSNSSEVSNVEMVREALVMKEFDCFLQCDDVPFTCDVLLNCPSFPLRGPGFKLRMPMRLCLSERFGTLLSKLYFGWGERFSRR